MNSAHHHRNLADPYTTPGDKALSAEILAKAGEGAVALKPCSCAEVYGENPDCILHGVETDWALENTLPHDWQDMVIKYREKPNMLREAQALAVALEALVNSFEKHRPKQLWDDARAALAAYRSAEIG